MDEVHMLNEERRGATLEVVVSRMRAIEHFERSGGSGRDHEGIRYVATSATIPNYQDIAKW